MKKVLSLLAVCLLLVGMVGFSASAATPKEEIIAAAKAALPDEYEALHMPAIENVLSQIDVTAEQAEAVIANIDAAKAAVKEDKGQSAHTYSAAEIDAVMVEFDAACKTLGLTYEFADVEAPTHKGDQVIYFYKADGTPVGDFDGDGVKKTGESNVAMIAVMAGALALAAAAVFCGKKIAAR